MFNLDNDYIAVEQRFRVLEAMHRDLSGLATKLDRQVASLLDDRKQQQPPPGAGGSGGNWIGQTTAAVPAFYGAGGRVKLTTLAMATPTAEDPTHTDGGADPVKAYNGTGKAIPAGRNCGGYSIGPHRVISWANCAGTGPDPAPAAAPTAVTTNTTTPVSDGTGQPVMTS